LIWFILMTKLKWILIILALIAVVLVVMAGRAYYYRFSAINREAKAAGSCLEGPHWTSVAFQAAPVVGFAMSSQSAAYNAVSTASKDTVASELTACLKSQGYSITSSKLAPIDATKATPLEKPSAYYWDIEGRSQTAKLGGGVTQFGPDKVQVAITFTIYY
jgi:uncharacterized membrane protein